MADSTESSEQQVTPTLGETARRREDLYRSILALERAAARPAVERQGEWTSGVIEALEALEREILEHIEITEGPEGLYNEIVESGPRLGHKVQRLREEHPELLEATATLRTRLETKPVGDERSLAEARDEIQRLLGRLVKHRQLGADLVWEAYGLDIGGIG
jgi:hypothetical protein